MIYSRGFALAPAGKPADPAPSPPLVLASTSPRRWALVAALGLSFTVIAPDVDESPRPGERADTLAKRLAVAKATAVGRPGAVVLAADTVVTQGERIFGKPRDAAEAEDMLRQLRGTRHDVVTAVCVLPAGGSPLVRATCTAVWMRPLTDAELQAYVATGEPLDKAGAYAIQDVTFRPVARIDGCYTNVVGLPVCATRALLEHAGIRIPRAGRTCDHDRS